MCLRSDLVLKPSYNSCAYENSPKRLGTSLRVQGCFQVSLRCGLGGPKCKSQENLPTATFNLAWEGLSCLKWVSVQITEVLEPLRKKVAIEHIFRFGKNTLNTFSNKT